MCSRDDVPTDIVAATVEIFPVPELSTLNRTEIIRYGFSGLRYFVWVGDKVSGTPSADRMSSLPTLTNLEEPGKSRARSGALSARPLYITDSFGYSHSSDGPWSADAANQIDSEPRRRYSTLFHPSYPHEIAKSHLYIHLFVENRTCFPLPFDSLGKSDLKLTTLGMATRSFSGTVAVSVLDGSGLHSAGIHAVPKRRAGIKHGKDVVLAVFYFFILQKCRITF